MARQQANKGDRGGLVSRSSMERIGRAVAAYERGDRNRKPQAMPRAWGDDGGGEAIIICKTEATWCKGDSASLPRYDGGDPGAESLEGGYITAWNKFATIPADKWVAIAKAANGAYYLIAAECTSCPEC